MKTIVIKKSQLKAMVGVLASSEDAYKYKNTVIGYLDGYIPIFIKTNLNQEQWDKFCEGNLSQEELEKTC
ncbi:hypothetical protein SAMN02745134_00825 [Clostridium acidisoli DSM 12555]|uniref:Uncharacterized protein n=1 Tax=Clostridium acidisoli DSM 12555 TaxID=1121291 RepID=A0A1W1X6G7_9CLOT|nr:hypothetical protein [Clostridium acidisoli]SMC19417.1 hypothetical protein SAMN02745134_00825 [Clostridium acidisoli DSM 12555]